ncbi:hypothetical protein [Hymenobacter psychrophilus]|uniref:Cro/C1-type HTH DNA-binding domain-containing protein n=1 Tax=Hymenobacter psychrophilus TaxID=651662 RepID=A0A1H3P510_9BACT|nr:hypothetical protein [Hymenobacter psychrophilus]SDY96234.1 hypothetical protein SAMN04488069_12212 [Hymenobacter psychrophilus]
MRSTTTPLDNRLQPGQVPALKRPPKPSGRTLEDWLTSYLRADGTRGLTVRELTGALRMGSETLALARLYPERLSMAHVFALAELLGIAPEQLIADLFQQVKMRSEVGLMLTARQIRARRKPRPATPRASDKGVA